jgi:acetamidase/formamidase
MTGREHTLDKRRIHHKWDKRIPPAIEIASGDTVHCETAEVTNNQITAGCPASALGVLCSLAVDLKISQIVDAPNWGVSAYLALGVFTN